MSGALNGLVSLPSVDLGSGLESSTLGTGGYVGEGYQQTDLVNEAVQAANTYGVPAGLFVQQIADESGFNPEAVSNTGVQGIGQITANTWAEITGGQPYSTDPTEQLNVAAATDAAYYQQTGSWAGALAAYNVGPNGNAADLSPAYQSLVAEAQQYGNGVTGSGVPVNADNTASNAGGYSGGGFWSFIGNALSGDAQAQGEVSGAGTPGVNQQAPSAASMFGWVGQVEGWLGSGVLQIAVVLIGVIFLAAALFMLGGGKPRDLAVLAE